MQITVTNENKAEFVRVYCYEKMAKSTGNFLTIESVLKKYSSEVLRYFLLSSHYRSVLNYSDEYAVTLAKVKV